LDSLQKYNPSTAGFHSTWIVTSELLVPKSGEVGVAIALESLFGIRSETDSDVARFLEIPHKIESCFSMWFARIQGVLGELMRSIHDVWPGGLGQIVEFTNHGSVVEI
jgi:hypothetical protein